ncbi:hypothetical protein [Desulfotomaculum nigrificans]|uniref:hypothetical protein n=1 Tax=Desulfotomaculum nigrificans TaxID=1565 RepID=UPI0001FAE734|nr:hypothetical protein [Desulfotomaculum nigrificans]
MHHNTIICKYQNTVVYIQALFDDISKESGTLIYSLNISGEWTESISRLKNILEQCLNNEQIRDNYNILISHVEEDSIPIFTDIVNGIREIEYMPSGEIIKR